MKSVISRLCCIALLAVWHSIGFAQPGDLSPLLPPADPATGAIAQAIRSGDTARAAELLASLDPATRTQWAGILAITQNDANGAIRILRKGDYPKALGVAYYLAGQKILFREQMAEAIRRSPDDFGPYYYLGRYYDSDVDDTEEAARLFRLALEKNSAYAPALSHLGACLERMGQNAEAEAAYQASVRVPLSLVGLARLRLTIGDPASALIFIQKAIGLNPRDTMALKLAARIYRELNRPLDAVRVLESAALSAPREASIRYQLARLYRLMGDHDKSSAALDDFERLRAIYGLSP
jgi:tetratricopeptide (TPR) repeat protein